MCQYEVAILGHVHYFLDDNQRIAWSSREEWYLLARIGTVSGSATLAVPCLLVERVCTVYIAINSVASVDSVEGLRMVVAPKAIDRQVKRRFKTRES